MGTDEVGQILRSHDLRVTPQRRAILQAFRGTADEHLSAEEVLSRASVSVPELGRGTVYATLAELSELGVLGSVGTADPIRYETNHSVHDHFRCRLCLRLFDVDLGEDRLPRRRLDGYRIESISIHLEGVCAECERYERGLIQGAAEMIDTPQLDRDEVDRLACATLPSPLGDLALAASEEGVVRVAFSDHADFDGLSAQGKRRRGAAAARGHLKGVSETLTRYFAGDKAPARDSVDWRALSSGQVRTLQGVHEIPYATPRSYERLAGELDAYDRGRLMGRNPVPLVIPCHRVSRGTERLRAYVGGRDRLRILHELEARA
jgi:Fe2+ or Zn2+ uptake regulation protein/O6-methylguanine-DNA--protein-cysteine methyltransferase